MTLISNTDHVLLLLRQQLKGLSERKNISRNTVNKGRAESQSSVQRVRALALLQEMPEEDLERTFIQGLLIDELGESIINDHKFQKMVDEVVRVIKSDEYSKSLLKSATDQLLN